MKVHYYKCFNVIDVLGLLLVMLHQNFENHLFCGILLLGFEGFII
jgi:hypothetical protein